MHILVLPSYKPHYVSCQSVCLSVCPSVCLTICPIRAHNSKTKNKQKNQNGVNVPQDTNTWNASFQLKRSKAKITGCGKSCHTSGIHVYLRAAALGLWSLSHLANGQTVQIPLLQPVLRQGFEQKSHRDQVCDQLFSRKRSTFFCSKPGQSNGIWANQHLTPAFSC